VPDHDAFLQAILHDPEDDAPRLLYADWLEERGDPYGEFIRVQCELARLAPDTPGRQELQRREYELLAEWEPVWARPFIGRVKRWRFRRGFIEQVKLAAGQFEEVADTLFRLAPVRNLQIKHYGPLPLRDLAGSPHLGRLARLDLKWNEIGDAGVLALAESPHLSQLTHLGLGRTGIGATGLRALAASPNLPALASLDLSDNGLDDAAVEAFASHCRLPRLCRLDFSNNRLGPDGANALVSSWGAGQLTSLRLWSNRLSDGGARLLASLDRLEELDLGGNRVTSQGVDRLAESPYLRRLERLDLRHNEAGDFGAAVLARAPALSRLTHLGLESNGVGWQGARALANSPALSSLASLDLSENPIRDAGCRALAQSPRLTRLVRLNLRRCGVTRIGAKALTPSPLLRGLRQLDLGWNEIGPKAFRELQARLGERLRHELVDAGYSLEWAVSHVKANPPRCIRRFAARTETEATRKVLEALHGELNCAAFELGHRDPAQKPVLLGHAVDPPSGTRESPLLLSPLAIRWEPGGEIEEVIDCERHGYDGENGSNCTATGNGPRRPWRCPHRSCEDHSFVACFSYHVEPPVRDPDRCVPLQDQFHWFHLAAYCRERDAVIAITDFDCS
jgi:uncharacterized protein (TIGR02996 family)